MLLPLKEHRLSLFSNFQDRYMAGGRRPTAESPSVPIGMLASIGFTWLVGRFLWRRHDRVERIEDALAYLCCVAVLLGTLGGLGAMFSFYASPMIRAYNRISIFIACFGLFALALFVGRLIRRRITSRRLLGIYFVGSVSLLVLGALDQTVPWFVPAYGQCKDEYTSDAEFGRRMEAALPEGTMIWQLPYVGFPENPPVEQMNDYDLTRPYLHTRTLRFSYGAMRGREASLYQSEIASRPLPQAIRTLAFSGFAAIYIDRAGYTDHGVALEKELARLLGVEPLVSRNERHVCFDMSKYIGELRRSYSDAEWDDLHYKALHPVLLAWSYFGGEVKDARLGVYRACGHRAQVDVINLQSQPRPCVLKMACSCGVDTPAKLTIDGAGIHEEFMLTRKLQPIELKLRVNPGKHAVRFRFDGPLTCNSNEDRRSGFRVWNPEWHVEE